ncbi:MAG TPA: AsmA family protein [Methyloceanibacter sp.]|nr:AsmA family protein [Methyloceanibacter sp.]
MNSFLLALTAFLILVLSALFAAPLFIDWNDYRPVFETQATKLLGRQVKVGGEVHLVLLPAPELRFDDIKVADQQGRLDRPFLEARSVQAWLNIGALMSGGMEAKQISIVDPVLRLDVKSDGTGNWSDVGRRGVALPFAPKNVMLDSVNVSGGRVEITKEGAARLTLENVNGAASAQSLSGPYKVSATYDFEGRSQELRFSTSEPDAAGLFRVKSSLRDPERNTTYLLDGGVSGLGAKPLYDGNIVVRVAKAAGDDTEQESEPAKEEQQPGAANPVDKSSLLELKGPLKATPEGAELSDFDLTIHSDGHPQLFKGKITLDYADRFKTTGQLTASFVDLDLLFGAPGAEVRPSPAVVLYTLADEALGEAAEFGEGSFAVALEQASLGGDLIGTVDLALSTQDGGVKVERLKAVLPGGNRLETSGRLSRGDFGPVFTGPIKLEGSGLRPLTRWAAGDRDTSGQVSTGEFTLQGMAKVGDGELKLAEASGELSGTKFRGDLRFQGGARSLIELSLDSDRLDLREMIGDGPIWRSWMPETPTAAGTPAPQATPADEQNLLTQFRDDDVRVTLRVGELLLPNIPAGKLDARFSLINGTLDVEQLDFTAGSAIALNGKGRIERLSEAPSGRVDFGLKASTADSLRIASGLFGLPDNVTKSPNLASLAPLDLHVGLVAAREGEATRASVEVGGHAGGSDIALAAHALGEPAKLSGAKIDLNANVTGARPEAILVLLFPDLPAQRIAAASGGGQGRLTVNLAGVPSTNVVGKAELATAAMDIAFEGHGSLQDSGIALAGKGSATSKDASLALMLVGLEAPPSTAGVPLSLRGDLVKQGPNIDLAGVTGFVADQAVEGTAHFDKSGGKTRFKLTANADSVSLPSLLGVLVAWQRTPSTEETLGAIGAGASEVWPSRGFSLGIIENSEGEITLNAKKLGLGEPFQVTSASLQGRVDKDGLTVTNLSGRLFGGTFAASGSLTPLGAGADLKAHVGITAGKLDELSRSIFTTGLAKGPFDLAFNLQGEGLSPPGLVAGLSGEGTLSLGPGALLALNPDPLRRVAVVASNKRIKVDRDQIAEEARTVREKVTKGIYKYGPTKLAFDVKSGTLRLAPTTLASPTGVTKINGYVELASLKVDSEWAVSLAGARNQDVPPVTLVFAGALNQAAIAPSIDTGAIESYLTMRRMQEDVERLERLDVSGKTQPPAENEPAAESPPPEPPAEAAQQNEPSPRAETESPQEALPQSAPTPSANAEPPPTEALDETPAQPESDGIARVLADPANAPPPEPSAESGGQEPPASQPSAETSGQEPPAPPTETGEPEPSPPAARPTETAEPEASPPAARPTETAEPETSAPVAPTVAVPEEPPLPSPAPDSAGSQEAQPTAAAAEVTAPPRQRTSTRPRRPLSAPRGEAPDAWKKGISIFGP